MPTIKFSRDTVEQVTKVTQYAIDRPRDFDQQVRNFEYNSLMQQLFRDAQLPPSQYLSLDFENIVGRYMLIVNGNQRDVTLDRTQEVLVKTFAEYSGIVAAPNAAPHFWAVVVDTGVPGTHTDLHSSAGIPLFEPITLVKVGLSSCGERMLLEIMRAVESESQSGIDLHNCLVTYTWYGMVGGYGNRRDPSTPYALFNQWVGLWDAGNGFHYRHYYYFDLSVGQTQKRVLYGDTFNQNRYMAPPVVHRSWADFEPQMNQLQCFFDWINSTTATLPSQDKNSLILLRQFSSYGQWTGTLSMRVIFYIMALESFLGSSGEIVRTISYRLAQIIADNQSDAHETVKRFKNYYFVRSQIVHGKYSEDAAIQECIKSLFSGERSDSVVRKVDEELREWVIGIVRAALTITRGNDTLASWADKQSFSGKP